MKISFITLFPDLIKSFKEHSIIKNAINSKKIEIEVVNIRDFATDKHKRVDDYVYGGGPGMLLLIEPVYKAIQSVKTEDSYVILMGPKGKRFNQNYAQQFSLNHKHLILICGHYEGIDSRIKYFIDEEISIGDFIVTGGEMAAMLIADSIIRIIPGVIKEESVSVETFNNNRLEYDQFSKPINFLGYEVPKVLLNGNHKEIEKWRNDNSINNTIEYIFNKKNEGRK